MKTIKNERIIPCDVDSTLIFPLTKDTGRLGANISIFDAVTRTYKTMVANNAMVRLLKEEKHRGATIIVWSRGGYEWAENVVKALGLTKHVDLIMSKPISYFDDKPVNEWMVDRVYLPLGEKYKE